MPIKTAMAACIRSGYKLSVRIFLRTAFGLDVSGERRISELRMLKIQTEGRRPNSMGLYLRSRQGRRLYMDGR